MKLSDLKHVLVGKKPMEYIKLSIAGEVKEHNELLTKGGSAYVYLCEDTELAFGKTELNVLCNAFLNDELCEIELNYIADALLLAEKVFFESEIIKENVEVLTDPIVNGHITKEFVRQMLQLRRARAIRARP